MFKTETKKLTVFKPNTLVIPNDFMNKNRETYFMCAKTIVMVNGPAIVLDINNG